MSPNQGPSFAVGSKIPEGANAGSPFVSLMAKLSNRPMSHQRLARSTFAWRSQREVTMLRVLIWPMENTGN